MIVRVPPVVRAVALIVALLAPASALAENQYDALAHREIRSALTHRFGNWRAGLQQEDCYRATNSLYRCNVIFDRGVWQYGIKADNRDGDVVTSGQRCKGSGKGAVCYRVKKVKRSG